MLMNLNDRRCIMTWTFRHEPLLRFHVVESMYNHIIRIVGSALGVFIMVFVILPALTNSGACDIDTVVLDVVDRQIIRDNLANSPELAEMRLLWKSYETGSVDGCEAVVLLELDGDNRPYAQ